MTGSWFTVTNDDECCEECQLARIRDVRCNVCKELYVVTQDDLDEGWIPVCGSEHGV